MPLIPDDLVDRVKREISIVLLVTRDGVDLRRVGANLVGPCPGHVDDTPSLVVTEEKNLWHDMGACQRGGSVIDWVMWREDLGFHEATRKLLEEFFPDEAQRLFGSSPSRPSRRFRAEPLACPLEEEAEDQELDRQVVSYYHETGKQSPELHAFLEKRALVSSELVTRFQLGLANRTLGLSLTAKLRERCQARGWFRKESGHEHLRGSLTVPILGPSGEVLNCYGRKIRDDLRPGTPDHLYLPRPLHGVLNPEAFAASGEIVLCEAPIDFLSAWTCGFRNSTCTWGAEGFTEDHLEAFVSHGIEQCLIAFDRDEAGDNGARTVARKLGAVGVACYRVLFPKGMDVNDVVRKMHPADKTLSVFFRSAEWICGGNGHKSVDLGATLPLLPLPEAQPRSSAAPFVSLPHEPPNGKRVPLLAALTPPAASAIAVKPEDCETPETAEAAAQATTEPLGAAKSESSSEATEGRSISAPGLASSAPVRAEGLVKLMDSEALFAFEDRRYRVRDIRKGVTYGSLRVSIRAEREGDYFAPPSPIAGWFLDTLDLCLSRQRALFEKQAAHELGVKDEVIRWDLGRIVKVLEELQEKRAAEALEPKVKLPAMTEEEHAEALALAKDPNLLSLIVEGFARAGIVGETTNALVLYLATISRKLDRPLAVVIRSSSAAGKTALMDAVLSFIPDEEQERYSALTENVLFYFEGKDFKHKILAIAEQQGAERASYPLKLLQSEGVVKAASTGKDPATGRLEAKEYRVEGPLMILLTSTAVDMDEEFLNRCLVLTVDESREQTRRIHELQREAETLEGFLRKSERSRLEKLHKNFQRLLRPLPVFNPFSRELTFLDDQTRTRRDHPKYLALIRSIALLHQHQRPIKTCLGAEGKSVEYIEVTREDIALANRLASEILGHSLGELQPQTRKLLVLLHAWASGECDKHGVTRQDFLFSRRQARDSLRWGDTQMKIHMGRLVELEYLLVHRGGRGQSFVYELLYEGQGKDGTRFLLGLNDDEQLAHPLSELGATEVEKPARTDVSDEVKADYDRNRSGSSEGWSGQNEKRSGLGRPLVGGWSAGGRGEETSPRPAQGAAPDDSTSKNAGNAQLPPAKKTRSYRLKPVVPARLLRFNLLRFPPSTGGNGRPSRRTLDVETLGSAELR